MTREALTQLAVDVDRLLSELGKCPVCALDVDVDDLGHRGHANLFLSVRARARAVAREREAS